MDIIFHHSSMMVDPLRIRLADIEGTGSSAIGG